MGFFNKPDATDSGLAPLSSARIRAALEAEGWRYSVDEDGDIFGGWDDGYFMFQQTGKQHEILYVRGTWYVTLTLDDVESARAVCNDWNAQAIWPKAYTVTLDDGVVRVSAEHAVDYEYGVTDAQLALHLRCAVTSACTFFETLNETFPEQTAAQSKQ